MVNDDGTARQDANGEFIFEPDLSQAVLHYEAGYIIVFVDIRGRTRITKMITIARGLTVLTHGTFTVDSATGDRILTFDTNDVDSDYGVFGT